MDLNAIAGNEATTVVTFLGETAKVTYKPSVITSKALETLESTSDAGGLADFLGGCVTSWELTRGPDPISPQDREAVMDLPLPLLRVIYMTVLKDAADAGEAESNSNDG